MVVENNIPKDTVVCLVDHQGKKDIGSSYRTKTNDKKNEKVKFIIPFGVVFCYADPVTGETKRISRYIIPNTVSLKTHQTKFMIEKLIIYESD